MSLLPGIAITAFDTLLVLGLGGQGFRQVEAIVRALIVTIVCGYAVELSLVGPDWAAGARGFVPPGPALQDPRALLLAVDILGGATEMPHNVYLHSSIVQTRQVMPDDRSLRDSPAPSPASSAYRS